MSETPQEVLRAFAARHPSESWEPIREAIRAVLAELAEYYAEGMVPAAAWAHDLDRLKRAEADRDEWRTIAEELRGKLDEVTRLYNEMRVERDEWRDVAKAEGADEEHERALVAERDALRAGHHKAQSDCVKLGQFIGSTLDGLGERDSAADQMARMRLRAERAEAERDALVRSEERHMEISTKLESERDALRIDRQISDDKIRALRAEVARLKEWNVRLLSQATVAEEEARQNGAEVSRLRDIITPGDAAAYEEGMAALQAKLDVATREYGVVADERDALRQSVSLLDQAATDYRRERDAAVQRAEDCCRMGERACAALVAERDDARALYTETERKLSAEGSRLRAVEIERDQWADTARSEMAGRAAAETRVRELEAALRGLLDEQWVVFPAGAGIVATARAALRGGGE